MKRRLRHVCTVLRALDHELVLDLLMMVSSHAEYRSSKKAKEELEILSCWYLLCFGMLIWSRLLIPRCLAVWVVFNLGRQVGLHLHCAVIIVVVEV